MSLTPAARRWSAILDDYESSGLSQRAFAKERGLNPSTLAAWRSKLGRSSAPRPVEARFTELVLADPESATAGKAEDEDKRFMPPPPRLVVRLRRPDAELVIEPDTDLALLRRVVDALC